MAHAASTRLFSPSLTKMAAKSLSIFSNFLATAGICLAMSPPRKTDSRAPQLICTLSHSSRFSDVS